MQQILETERLALRKFDLGDAEFILQLLNTPTWLQFIGDKNVKSLNDASNYLVNGPIKSYKENGFGLSRVSLKDSDIPIGACGLLKRDGLDEPDIGFALLPEHTGKGYAFEITSATMGYAKTELALTRIAAITDPGNIASINLLKKIGLRFESMLNLPAYDHEVMYFVTEESIRLPPVMTSTNDNKEDKEAINKLTSRFFSLFTNINGAIPNLDDIFTICIAETVVIKNTGYDPEIYNLEQFIEPRKLLLTDGTLTNFSEEEISERTDIFARIAHRFCSYKKSGILAGNSFETHGMKTIQFIKTKEGWRISAVAWDDVK